MNIRVYYEDTDCGNVVYYANYLKYMERSRTEFLRDRGIELEEFHKEGYLFAVTEANVKYRSSARYNDLLTVESELIETSSVLLTFKTEIFNEAHRLLVAGTVKLACMSPEGKARRIPASLLEKVAA